MKRKDFLDLIGYPEDKILQAITLEAEAQALWNTIRDYFFTKAGKLKKLQPGGWSEPAQVRKSVDEIRGRAAILRRDAARLQRVHNDPWSHVRSENLRQYGLHDAADIVDAARERMKIHGDNDTFVREAEGAVGMG
jgi:hypothetical protein